MRRSRSLHLGIFTGAICALSFSMAPAHAGNGFSPEAKAQFTADIIAFTDARPMGLPAMTRVCGQMRSGLATYSSQMPKWAISGQTDLCNGIDGLNSGVDKASACKAIDKSGKTFDKVNVRSEENVYIYTYIAFTAAIEMVQRAHCAA